MPKEKHAKFYVVFKGRKPGVYTKWEECQVNVSGYHGASFASFKSETEAHQAFATGDLHKWKEEAEALRAEKWSHAPPMRNGTFLVVDAACSGYPGPVEFRGVLMPERAEAFKFGPYQSGSNNLGEFLAITTGFRWLRERCMSVPVYSDSKVAIGWVLGEGTCNTSMDREKIGPVLKREIDSAERWLRGPWAPTYKALLHKWDTAEWGEIPADFGRK